MCIEFRRRCLIALFSVALAAAGRAGPAAGWLLPPLDGELTGEFTPLLLPGAPPLQWKLSVRSVRPRLRSAHCEIDAAGLRLRGAAELDPAGEGGWTLSEAAIDLGQWFGWVVTRVMPDASATSLGGKLAVRGAGSWRGGVLSGSVELELRDGRYEDPVRKLVVEGLELQLTIEDLTARRSAAQQILTWTGGHFDTIPFGKGTVVFAVEGETIRVAKATVAVLGGELQIGPTLFAAGKPDFTVTAQMRGLEIQQTLFLLPPVLAAAQGRLDGQLALRRSDAGIQVGAGQLSLRPGDTADLRFTPTPGLLSAHLPAAVRQHYPGLGEMETGGIPLRAERLEVLLTPAGDEDGRTASVRIEGGPANAALKSPVVLQLNVRGPLDSVVKIGTSDKLRFGGGK